MDLKAATRAFLITRRARVAPQSAGLPRVGGRRQVPGLRREEVALLAGVSVDYYVRLERGNLRGVSEAVLDALARALRLDDAERAHLFDLARAAGGDLKRPQAQPTARAPRLRTSITDMLEAIHDLPAHIRNDRLDILAANPLGRAMYSQHFDSPHQPVNSARFVFLDPRAREFYLDWPQMARDVVAVLHGAVGRDPSGRELAALLEELGTGSAAFRQLWVDHDVRRHDTGVKTVRHPVVGDITITFESMNLVAEPGLTMVLYMPRPGSPSAEALALLSSWTTLGEGPPSEVVPGKVSLGGHRSS